MKIVTWNVNSLGIRLPQLLPWLERERPDVVCLQETKTEDANYPVTEIEIAGYRSLYCGQKGYNGVAILTRAPTQDAALCIPDFADEQKRVVAATIHDIRVVCLYVPNGESIGSAKYAYKLEWLAAVHRWLGDELKRYPRLAVLGDFNIAPQPRDVHDPRLWEGKVLFSEPERAAFARLLEQGLKDGFRLFEQPDKSFTWWEYRLSAFRRNLGLRIDHVLFSCELAERCTRVTIDRDMRALERPSDHAPVVAELD